MGKTIYKIKCIIKVYFGYKLSTSSFLTFYRGFYKECEGWITCVRYILGKGELTLTMVI